MVVEQPPIRAELFEDHAQHRIRHGAELVERLVAVPADVEVPVSGS